jgi:hypothetical protein
VVATALRGLVETRRARTFAQATERMARDPAIRAECAAIARDLSSADLDGLGG